MRTLILALLTSCLLAQPALAFPASVLRVHDGDTVTIRSDMTVRLAGIDSPEIHVPGRWHDQPHAYDARDALINLIDGRDVDVECVGQESYRREVCRLYAGGMDAQEEMVREGWAWSAIQFERPKYQRDLLIPVLEEQAREAGRGLWHDEYLPPWVWRHEDK